MVVHSGPPARAARAVLGETAGMASPFLYFAGSRLSQAELSAACLDGDLVSLGEGFVPADLVETTALRAASLGPMLGTSLAASHLSAAWVFGGIDDPPARHSVQRAVDRRLHHIIDRRLIYHDPAVPAEDLFRVGEILVTTPGRTVADLARMPGADHAPALRSWARRDPTVPAAGLRWFAERSRIPHRHRADALLREIQDEVTR